jgi:8-oxo-dGTP pyrophosphatase MutT (NUDIX family)/predicted phosphodiesterase
VKTYRLAWATDIHLNFVDGDAGPFCDLVTQTGAGGLVITGDISEAKTIEQDLAAIESRLSFPIYFVLGNHDFYNGSIAAVRKAVAGLCRRSRRLHYLSDEGVIPLNETTALVGHDGWADGRLGDYAGSTVELTDYTVIEEFIGLSAEARLPRLGALGDEAADYFRRHLPAAFERFQCVLLATHVPPFREACWHGGAITDDNYLPHFTCGAVGDALVEIMSARPDRRLVVLCGHTHSPGTARILPNLVVRTGGAAYGQPRLVDVLDVGPSTAPEYPTLQPAAGTDKDDGGEEMTKGVSVAEKIDHELKGVAVILENPDGKYLVMKNKSRPGKPVPFVTIPTGTVERGEDPEATAIREVEEETGLTISGLHLVEKFNSVDPERYGRTPFTTYVFRANYAGSATLREEEKHEWLGWMKCEEIRNLGGPFSLALERALRHM